MMLRLLTETMTWNKESRMLTNSLANASYAYNGRVA
jgi:hypothetical protein